MTTMQITVSDSLMTFLRAQAKKLGFASPSDYVVFLLEEMAEREKEKSKLEASLLESLQSPAIVADAAFWAERRQKILDRHPELETDH